MKLSKKYFNVFENKGAYYTLNHFSSIVMHDRVIQIDEKKYRYWNPRSSKLAAALHKNLKHFPFKASSHILYLGASFGNTVSFLSDICIDGKIFAIEKSVRSFRMLLKLAKTRKNIYPILEDANYPDRYEFFIDYLDIVYQDIAQKNQVEIFNKNVNRFLQHGTGMLMLKTKAIDVTKSAREILNVETQKLQHNIVEIMGLDPYEREHYLVVIEK